MSDATDHDQLFKTVIRDFFPEFLTLFFPEQAARLDLSAVRWLDKELFPAPPDGPKHVLDLVAELRRPAGDPALALVHVEIESADSVTDIEGRLPAYYFHLRRTTGKPVLPVVVFLKVGWDGLGVRTIRDDWDGEPIQTLRYRYVGLPALPADVYLRGENWLGVALSALMQAPPGERIAWGVEAVERIVASPLSDHRKELLGDCVETYIELPPDDLKRFQDILEANATGRVTPVNKTRVQIAEELAEQRGLARGIGKGLEQGIGKGLEQGIGKGLEQGIEKGELSASRAVLVDLLAARFGPVPVECGEWVASVTDPVVLRRAAVTAGIAPSLEAFRVAVGC